MAERLTTIIDIQTGESVKATAALADAEARLKKESAELHRRLMEEARAHERVAGQVKSATKTTQDATAKLDQMIRREQLAAKIAKEHGTSVQAARRAVGAFGGDLDRAEKEASGYARALDRAQKETQELARAQRAASSTGKSHLMTVRDLHQGYRALAGAAGIGAAVFAVTDWIDKAERQDRALFQVEARLKSTGNTIGFTTAELAKMAGEIQRATGIGDEALLEQAGVILSFTEITKENFRGTLEAALDMAAALGKDVPSQVLALSKALSMGRAGLTQLQRSGTVFQGQLKEQILALYDAGRANEAQALILKEVGRQYGGAAQAAREHGGSLAALTTEVNDLKEALGSLLLEEGGLRDEIEGMVSGVRAATRLINANHELAASVGVVSASLRDLLSALGASNLGLEAGKKVRETLGLQQVEFVTWVDKSREAMSKALVVQKRWTQETKGTTSWEERMADAVKAASKEIERQEKAAAKALREQEAMNERLAAAHLRLAADRHKDRAETFADYGEEIKLLDNGLRTRKEILAAQKKSAKEHKEAVKAREAEEKAAEKAAKERAEALEHEGELWYIIGKAAAQAAEDGQAGWSKTLFYISDHLESIIDGFFMLGDVLAKAGREDLGQFATGIGQLAAGDYGGGIGSIAQGFGLTGGGMSKFGGAKHGNFIAEGAALGAQYGGVYGAIIGAFAGAFVKKGADDLHSGLEEVRGRADLIITEAQGELAEVGAQVEQVLEGFFNSIQDALIANLDFGAAGLEFHIREDRVRVVVNGIEKVFSTIEEALAFAAQGVLASNATAEGLGANMRALFEHLSGPDVIGSLEELQEAFNLAADLDFQETGVTGTYIKSRERALAIGRQYNMDLEAILALEDKRIAADRRALEAQEASVFGVDDVAGRIGALVESFKRFDAELAASEESRASRIEEIRAELEAFEAAAQEAVAGGEDAAGALLSVGEGGIRARDGAGAFRDDLDLTGATFAEAAAQGKRTREEIEALKEELAALEKAAQESLEALGVDEIGKLWTTAVDQVAVSLIDMIQAIQGPTAKIEELEEIRHRQFLFTLYAQIQQAKLVLATMEGVSQAVRVMFEGLISDAETLFEGLASGDIKFPTAGAGGRGGKAQARKQAEEDAARAAEDFNAQVALMTRRLSGASDAEIAAADALAELAEKGAAAKMSAEEVAAAVGMLAELQLRELAADWTQAAEDFGKVDLKLAFEQIQERAAADLATALVSAGDNREAYRAFRETVREGMAAELQELGQSALSGGRFGLRQEARESARQIRFLMHHLRELGLTANQVAQNVRDAVIPDLLDIIKTEAQRTGNLDEYNAALAQEAQLQRIMTRIRLEGMGLELRAANALTPAIQGMFDTARRLLDLPTVEGGLTGGITADQLAAISRQRAKERAAGGTGGVTGGAAGETTADIIARLERERASELERLEMDFQALFQSIADSTGTAAEKARALALAEEDLAEKRQEIQDRRFEGLRELAKSLEAEIIATKSPKAQIEAKQAAFQAAAANVDINDDASVKALLDVAQEYLDAAANYGDLVKSGEIYNTARDSALQVLASFGIGSGATSPIPQGFGPPPGIGPPGLGGTSFLPPPAQPIIVNAPAGQAANIGALSREIAALRSEVTGFKQVAEANFKAWIPARESVSITGNWIRRRGG